MIKRHIQGFSLRLNDLKEYEAIREERAILKNKAKTNAGGSTSDVSQPQPEPVIKIGPKTKQEIRVRIGLPME